MLSAISKLIAIEPRRSRHKHSLLLLVIVVVLNYFYLFHGNVPDRQTWYNVFYAIPLINTPILSVPMAVLASQSVDTEHKGDTWNLLLTLESKASAYLGKLLYRLIRLVLFCLLQMEMVILMGSRLGCEGSIPFSLIGTTSMVELVSGMTVYQLQCLLSLLFPSQFAALSIGFGGTLTGLFPVYVSTKAWTSWSVLLSLSPIGTDHQRATRSMTPSLRQLTPLEILTALVYLLGIFLLDLYLFTKTEQGVLSIDTGRQKASKPVYSELPMELVKLKRNPIWIPFLLIPLIPAVVGTSNFTQNQGILQNTWEDPWMQQSLFLGTFFPSPLVGILCSLPWWMEHQDNNWNLILIVTTPEKLVKDKWMMVVLPSSVCILWIVLIYLFIGEIILRLLEEMSESSWVRMLGAVACLAAASVVQSVLFMIFRSFIAPISLAFVGSIAGLWLTVKGAYYAVPYSMLIYGMGSSSIIGELNVLVLLAFCCFYALAALICSIILLEKTDIRTHV